MCDEEEKIIINRLYTLNICKNCIIRLIGKSDLELMDGCPGTIQYVDSLFENDTKRIKPCPCRACLDMFTTLDDVVSKIIDKLSNTEIEKYRLEIIVPKAISLRHRCLLVFLTEKFPSFYFGLEIRTPQKYLIHEILKHIKEKYNISYEMTSASIVVVIYEYADDIQEVVKLMPCNPKVLNGGKHMFSQFCFNLDSYSIKKYVGVPPDTPLKSIYLSDIKINYKPLYLGGRYLKMSRGLPQYNSTESIEAILGDAISTICGMNKTDIKLFICGRDAYNSRVLGNGRPFCIELLRPPFLYIKPRIIEQIVEKVNVSPDVKIFNVQRVYQSDVSHLKEMEAKARRTYRIICNTNAPNVEEAVHILQTASRNQRTFSISQKTPISKLHTSRCVKTRNKEVYKLEASTIPGFPNLFELTLEVDAGTFIDEFVNGDLGRTTPSIYEFIGFDVDVCALDVLQIHGDFPSNSENLKNEDYEETDFDIIDKVKTEGDIKVDF